MFRFLRREGRRERGLFLSQKREYTAKVKQALRKVRRDYKHLKPPLVGDEFYGSPNVDPRYLSICLFFKDDRALEEAERNGSVQLLRGAVISALREECYPQESVNDVQITFASQKSVRKVGGIWNHIH